MDREQEVRRRVDDVTHVCNWWQHASDAERVAITRIVIKQEWLERKLKPADAPTAFAD
jgi:hypothetical protein